MATLNIKSNCKDCKDRYPGCHSKCEVYIQAKKDLEEAKNNIREQKKQQFIYQGFIVEQRRKNGKILKSR